MAIAEAKQEVLLTKCIPSICSFARGACFEWPPPSTDGSFLTTINTARVNEQHSSPLSSSSSQLEPLSPILAVSHLQLNDDQYTSAVSNIFGIPSLPLTLPKKFGVPRRSFTASTTASLSSLRHFRRKVNFYAGGLRRFLRPSSA